MITYKNVVHFIEQHRPKWEYTHMPGKNTSHLTIGASCFDGSEAKSLRDACVEIAQCIKIFSGHNYSVDRVESTLMSTVCNKFNNIHSDCRLTCFAKLTNTIFVGGYGYASIVVWDLNHDKCGFIRCIKRLDGHRHVVSCIAKMSSKRHVFVSGSLDNTIRLWDLKSKDRPCQHIIQCNNPNNPRYRIIKIINLRSAFSSQIPPDDYIFASAASVGPIKLWHIKCDGGRKRHSLVRSIDNRSHIGHILISFTRITDAIFIVGYLDEKWQIVNLKFGTIRHIVQYKNNRNDSFNVGLFGAVKIAGRKNILICEFIDGTSKLLAY